MAPITTPPTEIQALRSIAHIYESWVSELVQGIHNQDGLVDIIESLTEGRDQALRRVKDFENDNLTLSDEALSLRESVEDLRKREATVLREKKRAEEQVGGLNKQVDAQFSQIEELQDELAKAHSSLSETESRLKQAHTDLAQAATGLGAAHGESDAQATTIEELRVRIVHLNDNLDAAKKTVEEKEDAATTAEQEIKDLKDKLNHANSSKTRSEQRNENNRQKAVDAERIARERVQEVESVLTARDKELKKAKGELAQARDASTRRESLAKQSDKRRQEQIDRLVAEKERVDKQLDAMIAKASAEESRASSLQAQIDGAAGGDATALQRQVIDSMRESIKAAAGGVRIALDKLLDQDGDYEFATGDPIIEKLRVAQSALSGDLAEQEGEK